MNIKKASVDFINTLFDSLDEMKETYDPELVCVSPLRWPYSLETDRDTVKLTKVVNHNTHLTETLRTTSIHGDFAFGELLDAYINDITS